MAGSLSALIHPEQGPSLPWFERFTVSPASNLVAAELDRRSRPGDIVVDLQDRGGWIARSGLQRLRRVHAFESNALAATIAEVVVRPPELRHFDAAVNALSVQPRGQLGLSQSLNELFTSRCTACRRSVIVDEFLWDGDAPAPARKTYRCGYCRDQRAAGEHQTTATDERDIARAASTPAAGPAHAALRNRFPLPTDDTALADEILALYTPRSLVAIEAILQRIEGDLRAAPIQAGLRLAFIHLLLPASRLHSYPGRVAGLRIHGGHVRGPGERQWRERNPWLLFEEGCRHVRAFIQRLTAVPGGVAPARIGSSLASLLDGSANVVLAPGRLVEGPPVTSMERSKVRLVLSSPPIHWTTERLSFAYLASALGLGREAAETLPLDALFAAAEGEWRGDVSTLRRSLVGVTPWLAPDARVILMLEAGGAEALVAAVLGGVGAGYRLVDALLVETGQRLAGTLEFAAAAGGGVPGIEAPALDLRDVERAVTDVAVSILQSRGEPARFERLLGEVLIGLDHLGHLKRLVGTQRAVESAPTPAGPPQTPSGTIRARAGTGIRDSTEVAAPVPVPPRKLSARVTSDPVNLLLELVMSELSRPDHQRLREVEPGRWWLTDPAEIDAARLPLADRVEWAAFSLLTTSGGMSEQSFFDRVTSMFGGADTPDEEIVQACLEAYRSPGAAAGEARTDETLQARYAEHTALVRMLGEYGHRLGMRVWISRHEQRRRAGEVQLSELLSESEERVYLPSVTAGAITALEETDCIWYVRGKAAFLFEVEWTAMVGETLRRSRQIPASDQLVRFLVVVPERIPLLQLKLERSAVLRQTLADENWHILRSDQLRRLVEREEASLELLGPHLGMDPDGARRDQQLPLFG